MPDNTRKLVSREHRHTISAGDNIRASLLQDGTKTRIWARILDLSCGGAKFATATSVSIGQWMTVHLDIEQVELKLEQRAQVCWTKPDNGAWLLGCRFDPRIEEPTLNSLAADGVIDRRRDDRIPVHFPIRVRWELLPEGKGNATVENLSPRGVCFRCREAPRQGQKLFLQAVDGPEDSQVAPANCQWILNKDGDFLIGCALESENGSEMLWLAARRYARMKRKARWRKWLWPWGKETPEPATIV